MDMQTDGEAIEQTDRQIDNQIDKKKTNIQKGKQTLDNPTDKQINRLM